MKTINMKRIFACLLLGASYIFANAQGIIVYKTDGTQVKVPYEQLDSIATYATDDGPVTPPNPYVDPITVSDLEGEWEDGGLDMSMGCSMKVVGDQLTFMSEEGTPIYEGGYTLQDGVVSFVIDGTTYKSAPGLAGGKSVLILKEVFESGYENLAYIFVKKGMTINTRMEDIQGQWVWWEIWEDEATGTSGKDARISHKFQGDTCELILPAWGRKFVGTYTYVNGLVHFEITEGYTTREEGTGYGWGEGDLDTTTLIGNWKTLYRDYWEFSQMDGLFFVIGDEAYSFMLMPCICTKFNQAK